MKPPFSPLRLFVFLAALGLLIAFVQIGLLSVAFEKLGLSEDSALLLMMSSLVGSLVNMPLFSVRAEPPPRDMADWRTRKLPWPPMPFTGKTTIAVNVGGCVIPVAFSLYLIRHSSLSAMQVALATALVSLVCYAVSRPIRGIGIGMPILVAPLMAAMVAITIAPEERAALAYICGTLGVLIGADLLRLNDVRKLGSPIAAIGGAGSFDGIFMTGLVAVLLA